MNGKKPKKIIKPSDKDYKNLGKAVQGVLLTDYFNVIENRRRFLTMSFGRGLLGGLGGVVGATIGIALLLGLLSLFSDVPFVGKIFESARNSIEK